MTVIGRSIDDNNSGEFSAKFLYNYIPPLWFLIFFHHTCSQLCCFCIDITSLCNFILHKWLAYDQLWSFHFVHPYLYCRIMGRNIHVCTQFDCFGIEFNLAALSAGCLLTAWTLQDDFWPSWILYWMTFNLAKIFTGWLLT